MEFTSRPWIRAVSTVPAVPQLTLLSQCPGEAVREATVNSPSDWHSGMEAKRSGEASRQLPVRSRGPSDRPGGREVGLQSGVDGLSVTPKAALPRTGWRSVGVLT